jgi:hypothetical protein
MRRLNDSTAHGQMNLLYFGNSFSSATNPDKVRVR